MSAILAGLAGMVIREIISYVANWISTYLAKVKKDKENHAAQVAQAAKDTEKLDHLNPGSTEKEVDDAIDDTLRNM